MLDSKVLRAAVARPKPSNAGKGRVKGVPNKTTATLKEAILRAFDEVGGAAYLSIIAKDDPRTFCALLSKVLPMQVTGLDGAAVQIQVITGVPQSEAPTSMCEAMYGVPLK